MVVKQAGSFGGGYDPDSKEGPAYGLLNDWAGIAFLDELDDPGPWPRFYGGDRETGVIVLEDLGAATQIDHILLGEDEVLAEEVLFSYVRTLSDLHRAIRTGMTRFGTSWGPGANGHSHARSAITAR